MRKILAIICTVVMVISLTACSKESSDYSGQTLTGQVIKVEGTKVTLQLGELSQPDGNMPGGGEQEPGSGQTPPELPDGSRQGEAPLEKPDDDNMKSPAKADDGNNVTPPAKSDDDNNVTPPAKADDDNNMTPPEKPDNDNNMTPSAKPDDGDNMTPPEKPDGNMAVGGFTAGDETVTLDFSSAVFQVEDRNETTEGTLEDIEIGSVLTVEVGKKNKAKTAVLKSTGGLKGGPDGFSGSGEVTQGTAANMISINGEYSDESYSSTGDDENALRVEGTEVVLDGITVNKSEGSSSNTEDGDFYGMNAALLATDGASVTIRNSTVTSSAQNGNGVFSYGDGTTVHISDSKITTAADNSGGIQTTGGGTTNAENLTVETSGNSSAAIRSDRGGGTVDVDGGSYTTNGYNSPAVYSTADITVQNSTLTANQSEALVIEGKNSIALENCEVIGNMSDTKGSSSDENVHNVMLYQSMSGDADVGTSRFSMTGGTLTAQNGDMFYVTNTQCTIKLSGVEIINQDSSGYLLNVSGNSASHGWGSAGSNGGTVEFAVEDQMLSGNIVVDKISTLNMTLSGNSNFTGTVNIIDNAQNGTAAGENAVITVEEGSTWNLTGDCTVTSVTNNGTIQFNGYKVTLADGTVLSE